MEPTAAHRPAAEGALEDRPVPRLLVQLQRKRVTGRLVLKDESGDQSAVYLRDGLPVHVERPNDIDRLDRVLGESGLVSAQVLARAEAIASKEGKPLGQVLESIGALSREALIDALRSQLRRKLMRLFFARRGRYEVFVEPHRFGDDEGTRAVRVDPRCLIYPGVRAVYDVARAQDELKGLAGKQMRLIELPPGFVDALGLAPSDALVGALRTRFVRLEEVPAFAARPLDALAALLAFFFNDLLTVEAAASSPPARASSPPPRSPAPAAAAPLPDLDPTALDLPPAPPRPSEPAPAPPSAPVLVTPPPARISPPAAAASSPPPSVMPAGVASRPRRASGSPVSPEQVAALRSKLVDLASRLDTLNHFELLGLTESATPDEVSTAYLKAVRQFHPDRVIGAGLVEHMKQAEMVMARLGEASSVLSDQKRRNEYVRKLRGEPSEADTARAILEAEVSFRKGVGSLKRADFAGALTAFTEAVKKNPNEVEYRAHLAWTRYLEPGARKDLLARETLRIIEDALKTRTQFAQGHLWIGEINKHTGDVAAAEAAFRKALEVDPTFLDAERELRLIEMRRKARPTGAVPVTGSSSPQSGSAAKPGGLLGKLLRK